MTGSHPIGEGPKNAPEAAPCIPQRSEREREILNIAIGLFAKHGYANTDVQQIADAVGVGKGTVYRCFLSKEALFLQAARYARDSVMMAVDEAAKDEQEPIAHLKLGMRAFLRFFDQNPDVVELLIEERALTRGKRVATFFDTAGEKDDRWKCRFQQMVEGGDLRALPVDQIKEAVSRFLWGTLFVNYFGGKPGPLEAQFDNVFDILIQGIGKRN